MKVEIMIKRFVSFFILIIVFSCNELFAQVTTKMLEESKYVASQSYDGTKNFLGEDVYQYIGQEVYLNGLYKAQRETGYDGFIKDYTKPNHNIGLFGVTTSNVYNCCSQIGNHSNYDKMAGRYFKVLDVIQHPKAKSDSFLYGKTYFLKLQAKDNSDILFYEYSANFEFKFNFPFIVVGFFEKQKRDLLGKEFVIREKNWWSGDKPMTDINTGRPVDWVVGSVWKGVDFTIEERFYKPALILQNSKGEQIFIMHHILNDPYSYPIFKKEDADKYRVNFGDDNWNRILRGKVKLGMTKEMCRLSWGAPKKINKTLIPTDTHEQWIYEGNYLYFDGDILSAMQQ